MSADFGSRRSSITTRSNDFYEFIEEYNNKQVDYDDLTKIKVSELTLTKLVNITYNWCCAYIRKKNVVDDDYDDSVVEQPSPLALSLVWVAAMENNEVGMADRKQFYEKILKKKMKLKTPLTFSQQNVLKSWLINLDIAHVTNIQCIETSSSEIIENYLELIEKGKTNTNTFVVNCEEPIVAIGLGQFGLECFLPQKKGSLDPGIHFFKNINEVSKSLFDKEIKAKLWILQFPGRSTERMLSNRSVLSEMSENSTSKMSTMAFDPNRNAKLAYLALKRTQRNAGQYRIVSPH